MATVQVIQYARVTFPQINIKYEAYFTPSGIDSRVGPDFWYSNIKYKHSDYSYLEVGPVHQKNFMLSYGPILTTKCVDNVPEEYILRALECESASCSCKGHNRTSFHDINIGFATNIEKNISYMTSFQNKMTTYENINLICNETCRVCSFFLINLRKFIDTEAYRIKLANKGGTSNSKAIFEVIELINSGQKKKN